MFGRETVVDGEGEGVARFGEVGGEFAVGGGGAEGVAAAYVSNTN